VRQSGPAGSSVSRPVNRSPVVGISIVIGAVRTKITPRPTPGPRQSRSITRATTRVQHPRSRGTVDRALASRAADFVAGRCSDHVVLHPALRVNTAYSLTPPLERKRRLRTSIPSVPTRLLYVDHVEERGTDFFEGACAQDLEGICGLQPIPLQPLRRTDRRPFRPPLHLPHAPRRDASS
jgi:hypothetical protein